MTRFFCSIKRLVLTAVCIVAVLTVATNVVSADGTLIISGFAGEDNVTWTAGDNVSKVGLTQFSWAQDSQTYKRSCLEVVGKRSPSDVLRTIHARFEVPLDLTEYLNMAFDIYAPSLADDPDAVYFARLTLVSQDGDSTEHLQIIEGGQWNHVEAYIGSWDGRNAIAETEIALAVDTSLSYLSTDSFYVDDISVYEPLDREMTERYLFGSYTVNGGSAILAGDKSKITIVSDTDTDISLKAEVFAPYTGYDVNCLRIRFANYTDSDTLTLYYSTSDSQVTAEDKSVTIAIEPNSGMRDYYAMVGDAAQLRSIDLTFTSAKGRIEIVSVNAISAYEPYAYDTYGTLTSCRVSADLASVKFMGEVERETALDNQDGYIAIFAHSFDELPSRDELSAMTPLVTSPMTTRFELSYQFPKDGSVSAATRFIAVLVAKSGEYKLISAPFYAENPDAAAKKSYTLNADAKGVCSNDVSLVGELDAGITLLEIDTEKLFVSKKESEPYIYQNEAYYFNGEYLDTLDAKIGVLNDVDVQVLLRIYNWQASDGDELTALYAEDDYANYAKAGSYPDGEDYISAIGSYIAKKWVSTGEVIGVIWGEGENVSEGATIGEMVAETSKNLRLIYLSLVQANPSARLYVSLTDMYSTVLQTGDSELGLAEYLPALIKETARYGQFSWEPAIESVYRVGQTNGREFVRVDGCKSLRTLLSENGASDKHMIFVDHTYSAFMSRKADIITDYVIGTYEALFCDDIDAYIAATGTRAEEVSDIVRYVFTDQAYAIENTVKAMLDIADFSEVVTGFDRSKLPCRRLVSCEAAIQAPSNIKGTFNYYRFDGVSSIGGLSPSYYSRELRIANDGTSVLSVELDSAMWDGLDTAAWLGIGHNFDIAEDLRLTPTLALTLKVDRVAPQSLSSVMVKVVLKGANERFEATVTVPVGQWTTVYVDMSDFEAAKDTESLHIFVGDYEMDSGTLKIRSIDGLSDEYNDQSLDKVIEQARLKKSNPDASFDYTKYLPIAIGVLVVIATIAAVVLLTRRRGKGAENE